MSLKTLLSASLLMLLMLLILTVTISIVPAVDAQGIINRPITASGDWSAYDVTNYPLVKPEHNLGISFYISPSFRIDKKASSAISWESQDIGMRPVYNIGSPQKQTFDLQKKVFICNII